MGILENREATVRIRDKEYKVRELSLAQKNKLLGTVGESIRSILNSAFFRKTESGGFTINFIDEVTLAELNIDKIILTSVDATPELLRMAIPGFTDWEDLPESESREALIKAVEVQDFMGYITTFFSAGATIFR